MSSIEINIAHRGLSSLYPENTLIAFSKALEVGVDFIELDIRLSQDKEIVVIHDETIERTTDGNGRVDQLTFKQIRKHSAGKWFSESFADERVPSLIEVIELVDKKAGLMIEIKEPGLERSLMDLVERHSLTGNIICISYFLESVAEIRRLNPYTPVGIIKDSVNPALFKDYLKANINMISTDFFQSTPGLLKVCHRSGFTVGVGTVNEKKDLRKALEMRFPIITTDYPQRLKELLEE